jgi:hypothetical protein
MKLFLILFIILMAFLRAQEVLPSHIFKASGLVSDFIFDAKKLYIATDNGVVDVFDIQSKKQINSIILPITRSGLNQIIPAKIHSIDNYNNVLVIVSSGINGFRDVYLYHDKLEKIIDAKNELFIKEAHFSNDHQVVFATFASEAILYDFSENYALYTTQVSPSHQGDFTLNASKTEMLNSDEAGIVQRSDIKTAKLLQTYDTQNVDKVFHIAYEKGTLITGGQDRRVGVYPKNETPYYIKSDFLVYCVGLTPNAKKAVYVKNEDNDLQLFDVSSKKLEDTFVGDHTLVTQIKFINNHSFLSSGRSNKVYYFKFR